MDMDGASSLPSRVQWEPRTFSNENGAYIEYSPDDYDALLREKVREILCFPFLRVLLFCF